MSTVMAMFPLSVVALPGSVVPLHIFEDRYRQMMQTLLDGDDAMEFAIVPIVRGREVGGGEERADVATKVRIVDARVHPDGRYDIVTVGLSRCRIRAWLPDNPHAWAEVDEVQDHGAAALGPERMADATDMVRSILERCAALGEPVPEIPDELASDPGLAVFQLAALAPVGDHDRAAMLGIDDVGERLDALLRALGDVDAVLKFRES